MIQIQIKRLGAVHTLTVDDVDACLARLFHWHLAPSAFYGPDGTLHQTLVCRYHRDVSGRRCRFLLHRLICGAGPDERVTFRDGNGLNLRRKNLIVGKRKAKAITPRKEP